MTLDDKTDMKGNKELIIQNEDEHKINRQYEAECKEKLRSWLDGNSFGTDVRNRGNERHMT